MMRAVLFSKSPLVELIWPMVTRIFGPWPDRARSAALVQRVAFCLETGAALYSFNPCGGVAEWSCSGLENPRPKGYAGSSPVPSATQDKGRWKSFFSGGLFSLPSRVGKCKKIKGLAKGRGESLILPRRVRTHEIQQFPLFA